MHIKDIFARHQTKKLTNDQRYWVLLAKISKLTEDEQDELAVLVANLGYDEAKVAKDQEFLAEYVRYNYHVSRNMAEAKAAHSTAKAAFVTAEANLKAAKTAYDAAKVTWDDASSRVTGKSDSLHKWETYKADTPAVAAVIEAE